jgi:hypothetical protein
MKGIFYIFITPVIGNPVLLSWKNLFIFNHAVSMMYARSHSSLCYLNSGKHPTILTLCDELRSQDLNFRKII